MALATLPWVFLQPAVRRRIVKLVTPAYTTTAHFEVNGYVVLEQSANDDENSHAHRLVIRRGRQVLYDTSKDGDEYYHHYLFPKYATPIGLRLGADLTGDGIPDLIIEHHTGGNGCGTGYTVFQIGSEQEGGFKRLADLPHGKFQDIDGDGLPEFIATDCSFAFRWTSHVGSPYPEVIMKCKGGDWTTDIDLMRKAAPDREELRAQLMDAVGITKKTDLSEPISPLLTTCLNLIYSGHETLAREMLREFVPACKLSSVPSLDDFMLEFDQALDSSPFAKDIEPLRQRPKK